jgi:polysaccharide chain length determinant protein (PEP-CTERM system associated)
MNNMSMAQTTATAAPKAAQSVPVIEVLHNLLAAAWRRRYLILLPLLLLPGAGFLVGSFAPLSYETKMTVLIQEPGKLNPFLEDLSIKTNLKDRMAALTALLTSRYVLQGVAEDMGMIPPGASESAVDGVVGELSGAVSVQLIGQELVELRYRARSPAGMDRVLKSIGERFMERVSAPEDSSMRGSVAFLDSELAEQNRKLLAAEAALSQYSSDHAEALPDLRSGNVQRLNQLRDQLSERETSLSGAVSEFSAVRDRLAQTDPVIGRLEQDIVSVRSELAALHSRYTDSHSKVQAAQNRLDRLEQERSSLLAAGANAPPVDVDRMWNLGAATRKDAEGGPQPLLVSQLTILEAARARVEQLRSETNALRRSVEELSKRLDSSGEVERELRVREREVQASQELVLSLRKRFDMAKVTGELSRYQAPERIKVIDRPTVPTRPTKPMPLLFAISGLVGGLGLGAGLTLLLELSDGSVRRIRQMEALTGVPVLGRISPLQAYPDPSAPQVFAAAAEAMPAGD